MSEERRMRPGALARCTCGRPLFARTRRLPRHPHVVEASVYSPDPEDQLILS